ncbi:SCO family protein [Flavobacterium sp. xlx-214]|uniref:SCO family protein n=1 Tax=unclassified Flavobacterium TaxID=196869 RepID=UPI0013D31C1C|nr:MULTISPECIES: SCO family protein [unclassified Flavobacterium]MBA5793656.1 SCO family protein [Flavobacterium sp. xlx-221]QMI84583.1 SCO family protein [Flavobacterium sp. xlx-214]
MKDLFYRYRYLFITMGVISAVILTLFYNALKPEKQLPIYTPAMVNPELVDSLVQHQNNKMKHKIADFSFQNQNNKTITQNDYKDVIYVADFFFTTCPTICPIMTDNMMWLQEQIKDMPDVKLLSFSVTPDIDTPEVLRKYADEKGVIDAKWNMVTGNQKDIYYLARQSFLAVKTGTIGELYDMVHTENFILVDKKGRIRGFYDGTNLKENKGDDTKNVTQLLEDVKWLRSKS